MRRFLKRIQAALVAAAFAEEGDADGARQVLEESDRDLAADGGARGPRPIRGPDHRPARRGEKVARLP